MAHNKKPSKISEEQIDLFKGGTNYHSYDMLGAHIVSGDKLKGVRFSVWAPNARKVSVVGNFNEWNTNSHPMVNVNNSGIWELFIPDIYENEVYKYVITTQSGEEIYKSDPYAFYSELRPNTASVVYDLGGYTWGDKKWQMKKGKTVPYDNPMLIYEVHLGSWKTKEDGSFLTYRELADELVRYVVEMGYTHIELLPIMEHPFDGSWGYQVLGYYSVTSRYGTPKDFMYLIDKCHQKGIGVILDWVPAHFPRDAHGLARYDGTALYEHWNPNRGEHPQWGTLIFDYGRYEVQSFLISNVMFWLECFHVDGFRVDAVTSMLYLDYARDEWEPNCYGGRENLEAVEFLKKLNIAVFEKFPNILMVAEDSSVWPMVTKPTNIGGLGFNFKWNMGWMNDTLRYCSNDPIYRKWNHNLLNFSLTFAFTENFILPLSHDEVVHGKKSLLDKMPGDYWQKFAGLRGLYGYMMAHPGKKLLFMGGEFGQFIEWKYDSKLDWFLLEYDMHRNMQGYLKELNKFYVNNPCLWENDYSWSGFQWIESDDCNQSVISFIRKGKDPEDFLIAVINFTPITRIDYRIGVPSAKGYSEVFNSDELKFGGLGNTKKEMIEIESIQCHCFEQSIALTIPPLSAVYYKPEKSGLSSNSIIQLT